MILGASALGQLALGATVTSGVAVNYVDCSAAITITSNVQSALTLIGAVPGEVNLSTQFAFTMSISATLTAAIPMPDPGVGFTISDKAGGV
jgi:hypothetical protein